MTGGDQDPLLWLEEIDGDRAMAWVRERNARVAATLAAGEEFAHLRAEIRQALDSAERIPYTTWRGDHLYNFWTDADHPRGLWRRTTLAEYREPEPAWQVLLDVDALAAAEGESWVWQGAVGLRPDWRRYLIKLSRGGSDAHLVREFDLVTGFVEDGFHLPEAKSDVGWIDIDHIYVGTDFGPGSLTSSGYARIVKRWRRGTPLAAAETVIEGEPDDMVVFAGHDPTPGFERDVVGRRMDFYRGELFVRVGPEHLRVEVPEDAETSLHREWLLVQLRTPWTVGDVTHPAGSLLATRFDDFVAGGRDLAVLFTPDARTALDGYAWTRDHLILTTLTDVRTRLEVLTPDAATWRRAPMPEVPEFSDTRLTDTQEDETEEFLLLSNGFLEPPTLRYGLVGGAVEAIRRGPSYFDSAGMSVRQFFAESADGTRVPYFVVGDPSATDPPTLLSAYGGFQQSQRPYYSGVNGRGWLARGGTLVLANIRGGGEYGPDWHLAALRTNRPRAFEDLAAVARDLVRRGVTTAARLGMEGASNGGLLAGVMLTRYPELFGAIVVRVPLADMLRYHQLLAGASWVAEYGSPEDPLERAVLASYSPYHNLRSGQPYPPVLVTTSTRDDRVHPGHARKLAHRLAELGYDVTYYENMEGGHPGAADSEQSSFLWALVFSFLRRALQGAPQ